MRNQKENEYNDMVESLAGRTITVRDKVYSNGGFVVTDRKYNLIAYRRGELNWLSSDVIQSRTLGLRAVRADNNAVAFDAPVYDLAYMAGLIGKAYKTNLHKTVHVYYDPKVPLLNGRAVINID